jgi:hypothetical protein
MSVFRDLLHRRAELRTDLLAFGVLEGAERERAIAHVATCERCAAAFAAAERAQDALAADPVRLAEPSVPLATAVAVVRGKLKAASARRPALRPLAASLAFAAVAALALVVLLPARPPRPEVTVSQSLEDAADSSAAFNRAERTVAREQAARYLTEAQDVLTQVASEPVICSLQARTVNVGDEAARSRRLLERRALFVDTAAEHVAAVKPVLDDVEVVLRDVATLDPCARPAEVMRVRDEIGRRQLLMRIRLMTRELQG